MSSSNWQKELRLVPPQSVFLDIKKAQEAFADADAGFKNIQKTVNNLVVASGGLLDE